MISESRNLPTLFCIVGRAIDKKENYFQKHQEQDDQLATVIMIVVEKENQFQNSNEKMDGNEANDHGWNPSEVYDKVVKDT